MARRIRLKNGNEGPEAEEEVKISESSEKTVQDIEDNKNNVFSSYIHTNDPEEVMKQIFTDDKRIYINKLKQLSITELTIIAEQLKIDNYESMHTQEMVYQILRKHADNEGIIYGGGILQVIEGGFGFLRSQRYNFLPSSDDIYVSPSQISLFKLRTGDTVEGHIRPPKRTEEEKFFALLRIEKINDKSPEEARRRTLFDNLTPLFPEQKFNSRTGSEEIRYENYGYFYADR